MLSKKPYKINRLYKESRQFVLRGFSFLDTNVTISIDNCAVIGRELFNGVQQENTL
jgi:hypothetical protein